MKITKLFLFIILFAGFQSTFAQENEKMRAQKDSLIVNTPVPAAEIEAINAKEAKKAEKEAEKARKKAEKEQAKAEKEQKKAEKAQKKAEKELKAKQKAQSKFEDANEDYKDGLAKYEKLKE